MVQPHWLGMTPMKPPYQEHPRASLIPPDQAMMGFFSFFAAKSVAEVSHSPASSPQSTSIGVSTALYQHSN